MQLLFEENGMQTPSVKSVRCENVVTLASVCGLDSTQRSRSEQRWESTSTHESRPQNSYSGILRVVETLKFGHAGGIIHIYLHN